MLPQAPCCLRSWSRGCTWVRLCAASSGGVRADTAQHAPCWGLACSRFMCAWVFGELYIAVACVSTSNHHVACSLPACRSLAPSFRAWCLRRCSVGCPVEHFWVPLRQEHCRHCQRVRCSPGVRDLQAAESARHCLQGVLPPTRSADARGSPRQPMASVVGEAGKPRPVYTSCNDRAGSIGGAAVPNRAAA